MDVESLKKIACAAIDQSASDLQELSQTLWSNPEIAYEEHKAHKLLSDFFDARHFSVKRHDPTPTAFRAKHSKGEGPKVVVFCEFDALQFVGHACGHNLIAEAGAGAALGIKAAMDAAPQSLGTLLVYGSPAEEGGYGKGHFIRTGLLNDVTAAMMVHPGPFSLPRTAGYLICSWRARVTYKGVASHAAAAPWDGVNALDAAVLAYNGISCLRQQLKPSYRVHVTMVEGGGAANVIPEKSVLNCVVRTPTSSELPKLRDRVNACLNSAAASTGCQVEIAWTDEFYQNVIDSEPLLKLYLENARHLGVNLVPHKGDALLASTDMGNVSHRVPSIHPLFSIGTKASLHTRAFADAAGDASAQKFVLDQAKLMALTALDVFANPAKEKELKDDLERQLAAQNSQS